MVETNLQGPALSRSFVVLLRPRTEGIPDWVRNLAIPGLDKELSKAKTALLSVWSGVERHVGEVTRASWAEIGPMGLDGVTVGEVRDGGTIRREHSRSDAFELLRSAASRSRASAGGDVLLSVRREAVREFLQELDPGILSTLRRLHILDSHLYNWCAVAPDRRPSALMSWPVWAKTMSGLDRGGDAHLRIEASIHAGGSLEDALAATACPDREILRHLSRMPRFTARTGRTSWFDASDLVAKLKRTPKGFRPRRPAEWELWRKLWAAVDRAQGVFRLGEDEADRLFADSAAQKDWLSVLSGETETGVASKVTSARDCLHGFARDVLTPIAAGTGCGKEVLAAFHDGRGQARALLFPTLVGRGGIPALLRLSEAWHERIGRGERMGERERSQLPDETKTATMLDAPMDLGGGVSAVQLSTAGALREEGRTMGHCIGSYVDRAVLGRIMAFHLSGPDGFEATCTLRNDGAGGAWAMDDMRLKNDGHVARKAELAAPLVDLANRKDTAIASDPAAVRRWNETRGLRGMMAQPQIGVDRAEAAWTAWQPILPKRLRAPTAMQALEGPFFALGQKLCLKSWMGDRRKAEAASKRARTRAAKAGRAAA